MDFATPRGTPIHAAAAGTVLYADWAQGLGWPNPYYIAIDFSPGNGVDESAGIVIVIDHGPFITIYAHCDQTGLNPGDKVALGEIIGQTGNTGMSTGPHLHFEVMLDGWDVHAKWYGRTNPELVIGVAPALTATQRLVGPAGAKIRSSLSTADDKNVVRLAKGGSTEEFDGWINGPVISGIGVWFHDYENNWAWSGAFESQSTAGLRDLNGSINVQGGTTTPVTAPPIAANQRDSLTVVRRRSAPDKNAQLIEEFGTFPLTFTFKGYVRATDPYGDGNNIWFVGAFGAPTYFYSGGFTNPGTSGLVDLTSDLFPETSNPPVTPPVVDTPYSFALDFGIINGIAVEYKPANLTNVEQGNFPEKPAKAVDHWWGAPTARPSFDSVVGEFQRKDALKSAHWVVSDTRIAQMVKVGHRAYHAGPLGNVNFGIEVDPLAIEKNADGSYTDRAKKIQANVRELHRLLNQKYGYRLVLARHKEFMNTSCSDLDLATFEPEIPVVVPPVVVVPDPPVVVPPVVVPPVIPPVALTEAQLKVLAEFADWVGGKQ
jgi:murein DD-endopeptidase MepM/ murein hydrolase activator NlpD